MNIIKPPNQGPDPYNSWKDCESKLAKCNDRLLSNIEELIRANKVIRAANSFIKEYSNTNEPAEELESFDRLMKTIEAYNSKI